MTRRRRRSSLTSGENRAVTLAMISAQCGVLTPDQIVALYARRGKHGRRHTTDAPMLRESLRATEDCEHPGEGPRA